MKRTIKLAVAAAIALSGTAAFATNGDHLIGMGAKARGMGGVGIGMSHGAESALANPALITSVKGTEVSFGGTIFMPNVENGMNQPGVSPLNYTKSAADLSVIPEVAIAQKASDNFWWGIGMYGVAGMGTDYANHDENFNMQTNLQLMQFAVPLAYKANGFSIGIAPVLQYGSLDINYGGTLDATSMSMGYQAVGTGEGVAQDFGFGVNVGAAYEMGGLTVGASYKSAIDMVYKNQLTGAVADFHNFGVLLNINTDNLEQPAEIGIGTSYVMGNNTFAIDYKQIKWADAKGYKDFGWEDQNVLMLGYQFAQDNWALRAGYNHGSNPVKEQNGMTPDGAALNMFNLTGFPATVEDHYTVGGSYEFSKMTSLDLAYVYAPEVTDTYSMAAFAGFGPMNPTSVSTKHSQDAVSFQLNFNF
ncbi:MAG: outer membrane protein transport protein [Sulfuricurvum sp.]|nr:outer membrane protein transport protein [Sulfuricurvum sp.]